MAVASLSKLALVWFTLVTPIVLIDGIFVLTRAPASASDHTHPLADTIPFKYWTIYAQYDRRYSSNDDAFVVAQSYLNLAEVALGMVAVVLEVALKAHGAALKLAIVVCMMTLYKTIIYYVMDVVEGGTYTKHNSPREQFLMVTLPSSFWVIVPAFIMKQCFDSLVATNRAKARKPSSSFTQRSTPKKGKAKKGN